MNRRDAWKLACNIGYEAPSTPKHADLVNLARFLAEDKTQDTSAFDLETMKLVKELLGNLLDRVTVLEKLPTYPDWCKHGGPAAFCNLCNPEDPRSVAP